MGDEGLGEPTGPRPLSRLIRMPEVQHRVGLGRSTIYRWMAEGRFPKPVQLGGYTVAWPEHEIADWITTRMGKRDRGPV